MKKVIFVLLTIVMLFSVASAVTLSIIQPQGTVTMSTPSGSSIILNSLTNQIKWWKVISGGVNIVNKISPTTINVETSTGANIIITISVLVIIILIIRYLVIKKNDLL